MAIMFHGAAQTLSDPVKFIYADGLFLFPVVQQPDDDHAYVSIDQHELTQFALPSRYGNVGILAHNFLAGKYFQELYTGQQIVLIYDDRMEQYTIDSVQIYQALEPTNVYGDLLDLSTMETLPVKDAFLKAYAGSQRVVFQTCIEVDGNSSWGRMFVIATHN